MEVGDLQAGVTLEREGSSSAQFLVGRRYGKTPSFR